MTSRINFNGNGNGMGDGDVLKDMKRQADAAQDKHIQPAPASDYVAWASDSLRKNHEQYALLQQEHVALARSQDQAQVGLDRLQTMVNFKNQMELNHLQDMQRDFAHANRNIGYTLERCKKILDETATNNTLIANTLFDPLADNRKKIAVQKELGLRLRDVDDQFERCRKAVGSQKKKIKTITDGIQKLMSEAGLKLPPKAREDIKREDAIRRIALDYGKVLTKQAEKKEPVLAGLGSETARSDASDLSPTTSPTPSPSSTLDPKLLGVAALAGITIGLALFFGQGV